MPEDPKELPITDSLRILEKEIIKAIKNREWRTVILSLDPNDNVRTILFPIDDRLYRERHNFAVVELVTLFENEPGYPESVLFGQLGIENNKLVVCSASNAHSQWFDDKHMTDILRRYFDDSGSILPQPMMLPSESIGGISEIN